MFRRMVVLALCAAAGAAGLLISGTASAAPSGAATLKVSEARMTIKRFDAEVAAAHGFEIRTTADGKEYSVPKGAPVDAQPQNAVEGDCGISYVYEYGIGNRAIELYTGFQINWPGSWFNWQVQLDDRGGTSYRTFSGFIPDQGGTVWQVDRVVGGLTVGGARATVNPGSSWALLYNGGVCYSGGPWDTTTIT